MKKTFKSIASVIAAAAITASALSVGASASCFDYSQYINGSNPYSTNYFRDAGIDTNCNTTCTTCGEEVTADCTTGTCDDPEICTTCGEEVTNDCENGTCDDTVKAPTAPAAPVYTQTTNYTSSNWLYNLFANFFGYKAPQTTPSAPAQPSVQPTTPSVNTPVITDEAACAEYAREMLVMINNARAEVGAKPLQLSAELCKAANIRAEETATSFSHTRPNGSSFSSVLDDINYSGSRASGENIAAGNSTVSATFTQWMNSQGHYENMMNANYKYVGIGYYKTSMGYRFYWAQIFSY
ncbi:MAG: CAP domain-containing protein [Ruminococcus sp.]|nr:CAP domain-containing protein [Ruminococcus sp.]